MLPLCALQPLINHHLLDLIKLNRPDVACDGVGRREGRGRRGDEGEGEGVEEEAGGGEGEGEGRVEGDGLCRGEELIQVRSGKRREKRGIPSVANAVYPVLNSKPVATSASTAYPVTHSPAIVQNRANDTGTLIGSTFRVRATYSRSPGEVVGLRERV